MKVQRIKNPFFCMWKFSQTLGKFNKGVINPSRVYKNFHIRKKGFFIRCTFIKLLNVYYSTLFLQCSGIARASFRAGRVRVMTWTRDAFFRKLGLENSEALTRSYDSSHLFKNIFIYCHEKNTIYTTKSSPDNN